ncbi:MAG: hypothetical protein H0X17_24285, partial [Deltaproteobacteria bacterium]|nr:hypothetical protein [Deltaproteobacteria bacterium]
MYALPYLVLSRIHQAAIAARRRDRSWLYLAWSALAGLVGALMISLGIVFVVLLWRLDVWPLAIVVFVIMIAPVVSSACTRHVFVRLSWTRWAYYGGIASRPGTDAPAYGLCCAAWAFAHRPDGDRELWLTTRRDLRLPLGDA